MKRLMALFLSAMLVLSLVPAVTLAEDQTVTLWMCSWWEDAVPKVIERFESDPANEGYTLKVETFPINGYLDKITAAILGGTAPDVIDVDVTFLGNLVRRNLLTPFTEEDLADVDVSDFVAGVWDAGVFNGTVYAMPNRSSTGAFIYNKTIFDKAGVPYPTNDWEVADFLDICAKLTEASNNEYYAYCVAMALSDPSNFNTAFDFLLWGNGADYFNDDYTAVTLDNPEAITAIQQYIDLFTNGYVPEGAINYTLTNDAVPLFCQGQLAMMPNTSSWTTTFQESGVDYGVCLAPGRSNGSGGYTFVIPATAQNPDGGKKFVKWFTQADVLGELMIRTPSRISTNLNYAPWNDEENAIFTAAGEFSRPTPSIPEWAEIRLIMVQEMQKAVMGQQSAEETAKAVTAQGNALLAEAE